ncbi:hypothetical protein B0H14DRAFT_2638519 [Mycena olivaceomarginata]|nr:hypothetical protein B0H14DRAFT_2638519 [Mycena olivaceomarginata]
MALTVPHCIHNEVVNRYTSHNRQRAAVAEKGRQRTSQWGMRSDNNSNKHKLRRSGLILTVPQSSSSRCVYVLWPHKKNMNEMVSARVSSTPENGEAAMDSRQPETSVITVAAAASEQSNSSGGAHILQPWWTKNKLTTGTMSNSRFDTATAPSGKCKRASATTESQCSRANDQRRIHSVCGVWRESTETTPLFSLGGEFVTLYPDEFRDIYPQEVKHI